MLHHGRVRLKQPFSFCSVQRLFCNPIRRVLKRIKEVGRSTSKSAPQNDEVIQSDGTVIRPERSTRSRIPKPSFMFFFPSSSGYRAGETVM